jgi:hypothetical protein
MSSGTSFNGRWQAALNINNAAKKQYHTAKNSLISGGPDAGFYSDQGVCMIKFWSCIYMGLWDYTAVSFVRIRSIRLQPHKEWQKFIWKEKCRL